MVGYLESRQFPTARREFLSFVDLLPNWESNKRATLIAASRAVGEKACAGLGQHMVVNWFNSTDNCTFTHDDR